MQHSEWTELGIPNPGSREALDAGCKCPVLDNHHGDGVPWPRNDWRDPIEWPSFWINMDCPVHRVKEVTRVIKKTEWAIDSIDNSGTISSDSRKEVTMPEVATYGGILTAECIAKSLYRVKYGYTVEPVWEDIRETPKGSRFMKLGTFVLDLLNAAQNDNKDNTVLGVPADIANRREVRFVLKALVKNLEGVEVNYDYEAEHPQDEEE